MNTKHLCAVVFKQDRRKITEKRKRQCQLILRKLFFLFAHPTTTVENLKDKKLSHMLLPEQEPQKKYHVTLEDGVKEAQQHDECEKEEVQQDAIVAAECKSEGEWSDEILKLEEHLSEAETQCALKLEAQCAKVQSDIAEAAVVAKTDSHEAEMKSCAAKARANEIDDGVLQADITEADGETGVLDTETRETADDRATDAQNEVLKWKTHAEEVEKEVAKANARATAAATRAMEEAKRAMVSEERVLDAESRANNAEKETARAIARATMAENRADEAESIARKAENRQNMAEKEVIKAKEEALAASKRADEADVGVEARLQEQRTSFESRLLKEQGVWKAEHQDLRHRLEEAQTANLDLEARLDREHDTLCKTEAKLRHDIEWHQRKLVESESRLGEQRSNLEARISENKDTHALEIRDLERRLYNLSQYVGTSTLNQVMETEQNADKSMGEEKESNLNEQLAEAQSQTLGVLQEQWASFEAQILQESILESEKNVVRNMQHQGNVSKKGTEAESDTMAVLQEQWALFEAQILQEQQHQSS